MAIIEINVGRSKYKIEALEHEKEKIMHLAKKIDEKAQRIISSLKNIDEKTLLVIIALTLEDELESSLEGIYKTPLDDDQIYDSLTENMNNVVSIVENLAKKIEKL